MTGRFLSHATWCQHLASIGFLDPQHRSCKQATHCVAPAKHRYAAADSLAKQLQRERARERSQFRERASDGRFLN